MCHFDGFFPTKDMQNHPPSLLPLRSGHVYLKEPTVLNRMKNHISDFSDFYFLSYVCLHLQFNKSLPTKKKKVLKRGQIYRKDADCSVNDF